MNLKQVNGLAGDSVADKVNVYVEIDGELKAIGTAYSRIEPGSIKLVLVPVKPRKRKETSGDDEENKSPVID